MKKVLFTASTRSHIMNFHLPYIAKFAEESVGVHCAVPGEESIPGTERVIDFPLRKSLAAPGNFAAALRLRKEIRRERYDLIVCHTSLAAFFTRLAVLGMRSRPRLINMVHGYLFDDGSGLLKRTLFLLAEKLTAPVTDKLLTMNAWDFELAKKKKLGKTVHNVHGVGVSPKKPEDGALPEGRVLFYAAEFSGRKSQSVLIKAMPLLPEEYVLYLPGAGDKLSECRALAKELGVGDRVLFPGYVQNAGALCGKAYAAVTASRSEGLPFNVMEAMLAGTPVIASDVKGHRDLIADGKTGLLYPYGDSAAFAQAVLKLESESGLALTLAENARENIQKYTLEAVLPTVMAEYEAEL